MWKRDLLRTEALEYDSFLYTGDTMSIKKSSS